jgi:hypothetical protein
LGKGHAQWAWACNSKELVKQDFLRAGNIAPACWQHPNLRFMCQMRALVAFFKDTAGTIQIDYLLVAVIFSFVIFLGVNVVTLVLRFY